MQTSQFNKLPTFFQALENPEFTDGSLMLAGNILVDLDLEDKFGVFLLHRHFDLAENEVLAKFHDGDLLVSTPIEKNSRGLQPSSWCVVGEGSLQVSIYEYYMGDQEVDDEDVEKVLHRFSENGLERIFGIYLRTSIPDTDVTLYEVSDDTLRISLVSPWQDETHEDGWYKQSTYSFCRASSGFGARLTNAGIACRNTTDCYGCAPSSPMIRQALEIMNTKRKTTGDFDASDPKCLATFLASVRSLNASASLAE